MIVGRDLDNVRYKLSSLSDNLSDGHPSSSERSVILQDLIILLAHGLTRIRK